MLMQMLNLKEVPKYLDATDGLAAAVCHGLQNGIGAKKVIVLGQFHQE
ncbi:MAG: hypothetical protein CM15mP23_04220 [Cryomorphaceae bacterium]|nr:MAG: hypothetical protein CM15mP23_04220 [Cryomorphaceae bacterium]